MCVNRVLFWKTTRETDANVSTRKCRSGTKITLVIFARAHEIIINVVINRDVAFD